MATATKQMQVEQVAASNGNGNGKNPVVKVAHTAVLAGLGVISLGKEEVEHVFDLLIEKGESAEKESRKKLDELLNRGKESTEKVEGRFEGVLDQRIEAVLQKMNIPSRSDIEELNKQVAKLSQKVSALDKKLSQKAS